MPRYQGTLYGGPEETEVGHHTMSLPRARRGLESTGSLTGHILAQGLPEESATEPGTTARVVLVLLIGLGVLITVGLLVIVGFGGVLGTLMGGLLAG